MTLFFLGSNAGLGSMNLPQWHHGLGVLDAFRVHHHQPFQAGVMVFGEPTGVVDGRIRVAGLIETNKNTIDHGDARAEPYSED